MDVNCQKMICESFGYKKILDPISENFNSFSKSSMGNIIVVDDNDSTPCSMCGKIHPVGYTSKLGVRHLYNSMFTTTFNEGYSLKKHNFICEYCGFSIVSYGSSSKMKHGKNMFNVLVESNSKKREMNFKSDNKNELYSILKKPPKIPFVILINSRGTVLENLVYTAKPTISKDYIVVNYGLNNLEVSPDTVFESIESARGIAEKFGIEITSDILWNRADDVKIKPRRKLLENVEFWSEVSGFISKYDRDCRVVAKMILAAYLKDNAKAKEIKVDSKKESLFDF